MAWLVRYFRDASGSVPVLEFFAVPNAHGITLQESVRFRGRLDRCREEGLGLMARGSDFLESLKGEHNLYALRVVTRNNPRVLLCALPRQRCLVLLHAFKEHDPKDYRSAVGRARRLRDLVVSDPGRWVTP